MHTERVAIVTDSSRGIGAATALLLAEEGYRFCVNYRLNETAANDVVSELASCEATAIAVRADVGREDNAVRMFETLAQELAPIFALVNYARILSFAWLLNILRFLNS